MPKARLRRVDAHGVIYDCLMFACPGCAELHDNDGIHMLPVNTTATTSWEFDGNLEAPTLAPSILTGQGEEPTRGRCHSFLRAGVFEFLADCTHSFAGQHVPMPDLPQWAVDEKATNE